MAWPLDRQEQLKKYWAEGWTATEIAAVWSITRSAVLGQVSRMRKADPTSFEHRARTPGPRRQQPAKAHIIYGSRFKKPPQITTDLLLDFAPAKVALEPLNLSLLDLREGQCRYPVSEVPPHFFCGLPQQKHSSYCTAHHSVVWTAPRNISQEERARRSQRAHKMRLSAPSFTRESITPSTKFLEAAE